jgi:hypothetical protein
VNPADAVETISRPYLELVGAELHAEVNSRAKSTPAQERRLVEWAIIYPVGYHKFPVSVEREHVLQSRLQSAGEIIAISISKGMFSKY